LFFVGAFFNRVIYFALNLLRNWSNFVSAHPWYVVVSAHPWHVVSGDKLAHDERDLC